MISLLYLIGSVLITAAVVAVIFIIVKKARKGNRKGIGALVIACIILLALSVAAGKALYGMNRVIGSYGGSEYERITIDGVTYLAVSDSGYHSSDRDRLLGKAVWERAGEGDHSDPMYVYSIKGTDEYIYAVQVYDGMIFRRTELIEGCV